MIEEFSGGYYRAEMTVQPFAEGPAIERGLHDKIANKLYQQTNAPVTIRLSLDTGSVIRPKPENGMPTDVIGLPLDTADEAGVHPSAEDISVFILKPKHAYLFNQAEVLD